MHRDLNRFPGDLKQPCLGPGPCGCTSLKSQSLTRQFNPATWTLNAEVHGSAQKEPSSIPKLPGRGGPSTKAPGKCPLLTLAPCSHAL